MFPLSPRHTTIKGFLVVLLRIPKRNIKSFGELSFCIMVQKKTFYFVIYEIPLYVFTVKGTFEMFTFSSIVLVINYTLDPSPSVLDHGCHPNIKILHNCVKVILVDSPLQVTPEEVFGELKSGEYAGHWMSVLREVSPRSPGKYSLRYSRVQFEQ